MDSNIIQTWLAFLNWYMKFSSIPFRLDPMTMERDDTPPDFVAFRESFVNVLYHQDYQDHTRKPEIRHFTDRTIFWNPGDAFATGDLLEPGPKEVRNSNIAIAFRRIGFNENAGWGLNDVIANWTKLGHARPIINNGKVDKNFELTLMTDEITPEVTPEVTPEERLVLAVKGEMTRQALRGAIGLKDDEHFRKFYLLPALDAGLVEMTISDKPKSSKQKYRLTEAGRSMQAQRIKIKDR